MYAPYTRFIEWYIVHIFVVFSNVLLDLLQIVILSGWFSSSLNNVNSLFFVYLLLFICQIHYGRVEGGDKVYNFIFFVMSLILSCGALIDVIGLIHLRLFHRVSFGCCA
jgi:hypothetical protein